MRLFLIIIIGKIIFLISHLFNIGSGGTWPGEMALFLDKDIFKKLTKSLEKRIILIAGTNGKTTTAKLVDEILRCKDTNLPACLSADMAGEAGILRNESGGNVLNGLVSTIVVNATFQGKIKADWIIFEVDEATLPGVLSNISPKIIILLNLFRDQLDRYGEVDIIAEKWLSALQKLSNKTTLILNADDPQIAYLGKNLKLKVYYFGLKNTKFYLNKVPHATDSNYCPFCSTKLTYLGIFMSHLGNWYCPKCNIRRPGLNIDEEQWNFPLEGVYNHYNALAAILTAKAIGINENKIKQALKNFQPAFGRQEEFLINKRKVKIFLAKNPAGMNEAIRTISNNSKHLTDNKKIILLVLNDRIPDGKDVSWIWDVDTEELQRSFDEIIVSGDRAYDMGLRIKYSNYEILKLRIIEDLKKAIYCGIKETPMGEAFYILPTYSAMLEVRKILIGRKIL